MALMAKTILIQFLCWTVGLSLLLWLVAKAIKRVVRLRLPLARFVPALVLLAFLLALIPNLDFKGRGRGGDDGATSAGAGGTAGGSGKVEQPGASAGFVLSVDRRGLGQYELWLKGVSGTREGPVPLNNTARSRREVERLLQRARRRSSMAHDVPVALRVPQSFSDVGQSVLEDILRYEGFVVTTAKR